MRLRRWTRILLAAAAVAVMPLASSGSAHAYEIWNCAAFPPLRWDASTMGFRASVVSYPESAWWRRANWAHAQELWNRTPGGLEFRTDTYDDTSIGRKNGQNETWFSDSDAYLDKKPAKIFIRWWCGGILEGDIVFNSNKSWYWASTNTDLLELRDYSGHRFHFQRGAVHELGHAFGLMHNNDNYNAMGGDPFILRNGSVVEQYVGEDAARGQVRLYGPKADHPAGTEDLSVVHWRYSGAIGEYSKHAQTQVWETGVVNPTVAPAVHSAGLGMKKFNVWRGRDYKFEFTLENNGLSTHEVNVGYYLSTDSSITTMDRHLGTSKYKLTFDTPSTIFRQLRIPVDLNQGQLYYLGAIIDNQDTVEEWDETNNATFLPVTVVQ